MKRIGAGARWSLHPVWLAALAVGAWLGRGKTVLMAAGSILLHEWGHIRAAQAGGIPVVSVRLGLSGALAYLEDDLELRPAEERRVALAGPLVSAALCVLTLAAAQLGSLFGLNGFGAEMLAGAYLNLSILLFNLLPALPLDGGRILRSALSPVFGVRRATVFAGLLGIALGGLLLFLAVQSRFQRGKWPLPFLTAGVSVLIGALQSMRTADLLLVRAQSVTEKDLPNPVPVYRFAADGQTPLRDIWAKLWRGGYYEILLLRDGKPCATLTRDDIAGALKRNCVTLSDAWRG